MSKIQVMDEILANKIAAGEVVERCASVVKELVENSIDAMSTDIKIELIDAGTKSIKVTDNGLGMDREDAILSFQRHATSKIKDEDDLFCIETLGFRGEALASIASVSKVSLKTSQGEIGSVVIIDGGKVVSVSNGDSRKGTIIEVSDLFYNTPARLKHMKSLYTELASISDFINKLALSHNDIRFTLINNGSVILKTSGSGDCLKTINDIYGIEITKNMLEISGNNTDFEVNGFVSKPSINRSNRNHMITIVNGRVVRNAELNKIINDAYHSYKPDNRYPVVVMSILVDPTLIDVNIHPTKMDIKISKMESLTELVFDLIRSKIGKQILINNVDVSVDTPLFNLELKKEDEITKNNVEFNYEKKENTQESLFVSEEKFEEVVLDLKRVDEGKKEFPELLPIGLVHGTYIVCQNELGMYLVDQHAAKERVNYEIIKEKLSNPSKDNIELLVPMTLEFTPSEYIILKENFYLLVNMGFIIEEFGLNSIIIKSHPVWITKGIVEKQINKIIENVLLNEKNFSFEKFNDHLAHDLACKASIKGNTNISISEMEYLLDDLKKCENPFNCPHGRPTIIHYSKLELEKQFKRSGFESVV